MSTRPLLNGEGSRSREANLGRVDNKGTSKLLFSNLFRGGLVVSSSTTYDSVVLMLNAETVEERNRLTKMWRDHKLQELNFVGTVGALISGCLTSTGAWPDVLSNGRDKPWSVRACWWSGIIFGLFSVITSAQQALRLHRLSAHKNGLHFIRQSMVYVYNQTENGRFYRPAKIQVYAWQISLMFLILSVVCMLAGMTVLVWVSAAWGPDKKPEDGWWDDSSKMATTFTAVLVAATMAFLMSQTALTEPRTRDGDDGDDDDDDDDDYGDDE